MINKSFLSLIVLSVFVLGGCGEDGDVSDYDINIPEEMSVTSQLDNDVELGSLDSEKIKVVIKRGAFDNEEVVSIKTPITIPKQEENQVLLGSPIEIGVGETPVRLLNKTDITFQFDKTLLPENVDESYLRVGYFNGEEWEYVKPTTIDMEASTMTLSTYHFSLLAPHLAKKAKITEQFIHSQALDNVIRDNVNNESDFVTEQIVAMTMAKMGITDVETQQKIFDKVASAEEYKEIYNLYQKGDTEGAAQKTALLAGAKIAANVPDSVWKSALGNVVGGADDIAKASEAAGYAAEGQYKEAAKIIGEQIADKFLITTAGKIAVEVVAGQIDSWKNGEVDAAYEAYKKGATGYFWGYNVDKGDFEGVWNQMRGIGRQLELEAVSKENEIRKDAGMPELSEREISLVHMRVKNAYKKQFERRAEKEEIIEKEAEKLKIIIDAFEKADLLSTVLGPKGLDKGYTYEQKLEILNHFAQKMMKDTGRNEISEKDTLSESKISASDMAYAAKRYFSEPDGKKQYEEYLKERYEIGLYPTIDEIVGNWEGTVTITEVIASEEFKASQSSSGGGEEGCDLISLEDLIGVPNSISMQINPTNKTGGMLSINTGDKSQPTPFTYNDGNLEASISQDKANGQINLTATKNGDAFAMNGGMYLNYGDGDGDVKVRATIGITK